MSTTVQDILVAAYTRSGRNRNQQLASEPTELLAVVTRMVRTTFAVAARVNPFYFGKQKDVAFSDGGWSLPTDLELLFHFTVGGTEGTIVPLDQQDAEPTMPALYQLGQMLYSAGNALDPTSGTITLYYSRRPTDPATTSDNIDSDFPDAHIDVFINGVARYLAIKDGRLQDQNAFQAEYASSMALFLAHIEHQTASIERRKFAQVRRFNLDTLFANPSPPSGGVTGQ